MRERKVLWNNALMCLMRDNTLTGMKKEVKALQQKLTSTIIFIEDQLKRAKELDCSNPLRSEYAINLATRLRVLLNDENRNTTS